MKKIKCITFDKKAQDSISEEIKNLMKIDRKNSQNKTLNKPNPFELKLKFKEEFFNEFQFDAEFRSIFESMIRGLTPYEVIEYLCKSKKELLKTLERVIENTPRKIIVTTETFNQLKD